MSKDFKNVNLHRFDAGNANDSFVKDVDKAEADHAAENTQPRPGKVLPEPKPSLPAESVPKKKEAVKKKSAIEKPRADIKHQPPHYDISVITDRQTYDELCIRLKERGKNNRSGFRDALAELIEKQSKEDIEQAAMSVRIEEMPYKTSVRIPFELYLNVYRYSRQNHVTMLQIVNAAIAKIMS